MKKPNNPPAFPENYMDGSMSPGMSLRDWFAGQALQGYLSNDGKVDVDGEYVFQQIAANLYVIADAMLVEREKNNQ